MIGLVGHATNDLGMTTYFLIELKDHTTGWPHPQHRSGGQETFIDPDGELPTVTVLNRYATTETLMTEPTDWQISRHLPSDNEESFCVDLNFFPQQAYIVFLKDYT